MKAEANGEGPTLADVGAVLVQVRQPDGSLSLLPLKSIQDSPAALNVLLKHITGFTTPAEVVDRLLTDKGESMIETKQALTDEEILADGRAALAAAERAQRDADWKESVADQKRKATFETTPEEATEAGERQEAFWLRFISPLRRRAVADAKARRLASGVEGAVMQLYTGSYHRAREVGRLAEEAERARIAAQIGAIEQAYREGKNWRELL